MTHMTSADAGNHNPRVGGSSPSSGIPAAPPNPRSRAGSAAESARARRPLSEATDRCGGGGCDHSVSNDADLDRDLLAAEAAYEKALRHPRGEGLEDAGRRLRLVITVRRRAGLPDRPAPKCEAALDGEGDAHAQRPAEPDHNPGVAAHVKRPAATPPSGHIVDLFAGPGGWSEGLRLLGRSELGIEWDESAVATARAAGHARRQADVASLDPREFAPCAGLIASPPCQAWSMAGKGGGRRDVEHVIACAIEVAAGDDTRARHAERCEDPRSILVVEPLRWVVALEPEWIALEQVPPVLELWVLFAQLLQACGYRTWTGILEAERYGVPQTRERAILMASRTRPVEPPRATHQRYVPGEPQRHDITLEGEVLPWVSMAEALGWDEGPSPSPSPSVTGGGGATGGVEVFASKAARARAADAVALRMTKMPNSAERKSDQPAPTMAWQLPEGEGENVGGWGYERPATTLAGDPRVFQPGGHHANDGRVSNPEEHGRSQNAVRVTVQEASVLQSFPPDYPWQGSRSKQFEQVGNAVPPLLARAVLAQLVDPATDARKAA
jgi:DNA (cytosine-5)-methyltransferase 1